MNTNVLGFLKSIGGDGSIEGARSVCRRLVDRSELVNCAPVKFSELERTAICNEIVAFVFEADDRVVRTIRFEVEHALIGSDIEAFEFASICSAWFLSFYRHSHLSAERLGFEAYTKYVQEYYFAALYHYSWCARTEATVFPVSVMIDLARHCHRLAIGLGADVRFPDISSNLLMAFNDCEGGTYH